MIERCPDCGRFAADGENVTPHGSERYVWCSTCVKFVPPVPPLALSEQEVPRA